MLLVFHLNSEFSSAAFLKGGGGEPVLYCLPFFKLLHSHETMQKRLSGVFIYYTDVLVLPAAETQGNWNGSFLDG